MITRKANTDEWNWAREHTLKVSPREIKKDYSHYDCMIALEDEQIIAYAFYWFVPPNVGEIHRIAFAPDRENALVSCIVKVFEDLESKGAREVGTFIATDNEWELGLYRKLGFAPAFYWTLTQTRHWWEAEGISWEEIQEIRKQRGLPIKEIIPKQIDLSDMPEYKGSKW